MTNDHQRDLLHGRADLPDQPLPEDLETLIRTAVGWMHRRMRTIAPASGLTYAAVSLVNRLRVAGPQTLAELAAWEGSSEAVVGQISARLIEGGFIERDDAAGGSVRVCATERGAAAAEEWIEGSLAWLRAMTAELPDDDRAALRRASEILVGIARS